MKHKRKKIVVLLIVAIIGISTAYLLRTQKLSNVVSIADEVSIQAFNIGVNQDGDHDLYEINDVTIASQLNELFDDTEVRFAPLRYKSNRTPMIRPGSAGISSLRMNPDIIVFISARWILIILRFQ